MKIFYDSSSFIKRFIQEAGSDEVDEYCQKATNIGLSIICLPEMLSALNRKVRENNVTKENYRVIKNQILDDIRDAQTINLTPNVIQKTIHLLEKNRLRSLDALHISCAMEWQAELFISSDKRQVQAARYSGLKIRYTKLISIFRLFIQPMSSKFAVSNERSSQ